MDPFETLSLPRRPLLSEDEIGVAYRKLAGELHPDQQGGDAVAFRELGEAMAILRDPARRLKELAGVSSTHPLPAKAAEFFPKVAEILHRSDALNAQVAAASNALSKALLIAPLKSLLLDLTSVQEEISAWHSSLDEELQQLDQHWPEFDPQALSRLADSFAYADRWAAQLRERKLALECF